MISVHASQADKILQYRDNLQIAPRPARDAGLCGVLAYPSRLKPFLPLDLAAQGLCSEGSISPVGL